MNRRDLIKNGLSFCIVPLGISTVLSAKENSFNMPIADMIWNKHKKMFVSLPELMKNSLSSDGKVFRDSQYQIAKLYEQSFDYSRKFSDASCKYQDVKGIIVTSSFMSELPITLDNKTYQPWKIQVPCDETANLEIPTHYFANQNAIALDKIFNAHYELILCHTQRHIIPAKSIKKITILPTFKRHPYVEFCSYIQLNEKS